MRTPDEIQADAAGERPFSNHTEYEIWADRFCWAPCVHDDPQVDKFCPILTVALLGNWPKEWTRRTHHWEDGNNGTKSGSYEVVDTCTEFEERRDPDDDDPPPPEPVPDCDGQLDLIDAYLDTAIEELTPRTVPA